MTEGQRESATEILAYIGKWGIVPGGGLLEEESTAILAYQTEFERMRAFIRGMEEQARDFFE